MEMQKLRSRVDFGSVRLANSSDKSVDKEGDEDEKDNDKTKVNL